MSQPQSHRVINWAFGLQGAIENIVQENFPEDAHRWPLLRTFNLDCYNLGDEYWILILKDKLSGIPAGGKIDPLGDDAPERVPSVETLETWITYLTERLGLRVQDAFAFIPINYPARNNALEEFEQWSEDEKKLWHRCVVFAVSQHYHRVKGFDATQVQKELHEKPTTETQSKPKRYADRIIYLRDNINALCNAKLGNRLLHLPQERAIMELYKNCSSHEEFTHRVSSLAELASSFNTDRIRTILKETDQNLKSIALLERFLKIHCGLQNSDEIVEPLKNLNRFRQGYPVHTDHAGGLIGAHTFFGLNYPIEDWEGSWQILIEHYMKFLERLLNIITNLKG